MPHPTWVNRLFLGWYTASTGGTRVDDFSRLPDRDMTIYAHWEELRFSLSPIDVDGFGYHADAIGFYTGGDAEWAARFMSSRTVFTSGTIKDGGETWLERDFEGAGILSFYWLPSSESGRDICSLLVDGVQTCRVSGVSNAWAHVQVEVAQAGTHRMRWTYGKNASSSAGSDCVYVYGIA